MQVSTEKNSEGGELGQTKKKGLLKKKKTGEEKKNVQMW